MIDRQCRAFGLTSPFSTTHYNIKDLFKSLYPGMAKGYGMKNAYVATIGRDIEGTHHRGGDDARNIAQVLEFDIVSSSNRCFQNDSEPSQYKETKTGP
jgi:inhibitor of KinA sporulation pathway (predicted exonuclease)